MPIKKDIFFHKPLKLENIRRIFILAMMSMTDMIKFNKKLKIEHYQIIQSTNISIASSNRSSSKSSFMCNIMNKYKSFIWQYFFTCIEIYVNFFSFSLEFSFCYYFNPFFGLSSSTAANTIILWSHSAEYILKSMLYVELKSTIILLGMCITSE